ncbi:MAG TPA: hypothetical protein VFO45_03905 [Sphingomicrobium sp.]|nr:hypothetical protein [Sphingomicrobium sp.]
MRTILSSALLLASCSQQPAQSTLATGTFAGEGRDRLCIAGELGAYRAGLIAYAPGDTNCSAAGRLEPQGTGWMLVPKGEGDCRIPLTIDGNSVQVGQAPAACSYYCGPGATMAGKTFSRTETGAKVTDLAGDPLC